MKKRQSLTVVHTFPIWLPQTQTWMHSQVAGLQQLGVNAHVMCERTVNLEQFKVANIHCLAREPRLRQIWDKGLRKLRMRRHLSYLVRVGKEVGVDIVHSHFGDVGWSSLGAVRKLGVRHVVTFYGYDVGRLPKQLPVWRKRYGQLFSEVDLILCEGPHMAECIVDLGCPREKVKVQHLGVDISRLEFRPRHWKPGSVFRVMIAASFREKKGIPYAIEALGKLQREVPLEITLIGDAGEDVESRDERERIFSVIEQTGLRGKTRLLGYQTHQAMLTEAYRHHCFLHPSVTASNGDTEGGAPVSIMEMMATGMPVVSSMHCDIPEVLGADLGHCLAHERDVEGLVAVMRALLDKNTYWETWAKKGRDRIVGEYNLSTQAKRLVDCYEGVIE